MLQKPLPCNLEALAWFNFIFKPRNSFQLHKLSKRSGDFKQLPPSSKPTPISLYRSAKSFGAREFRLPIPGRNRVLLPQSWHTFLALVPTRISSSHPSKNPSPWKLLSIWKIFRRRRFPGSFLFLLRRNVFLSFVSIYLFFSVRAQRGGRPSWYTRGFQRGFGGPPPLFQE